MPNIFDYMNWRDIPITQTKFNEIDNLILSRLSYFPLDNIIPQNSKITIYESYRKYKRTENYKNILQEEDKQLYPILAKSKRFGKLYISDYINKIEPLEEKQFSALTIHLPNNTIYVAFRGTDNTIIGWKEDLNMCFSDIVPSHIDSVKYLNNIAKKYNSKILVGGHSKGGNLAVYASAFCNKEIQNRIIKIYNNDGPGFSEKITSKQEYLNILNKIRTYMPQTSIIGRLLNHKEKIKILKSTQTGFMQHDLYSWQVLGDKFIKDEFTNYSEFIDHTINNWLKEVTPEQRKKFINAIFDVLNSTQAKTIPEITEKLFSNTKTMLKSYQQLDGESKKMINKVIGIFIKVGKNNIKESMKKEIKIEK